MNIDSCRLSEYDGFREHWQQIKNSNQEQQFFCVFISASPFNAIEDGGNYAGIVVSIVSEAECPPGID
jgi:hypothetical protein